MNAEKIGIWMDHHQGWLTEFTTPVMKTTSIRSADSGTPHAIHGEKAKHTKAQHQQIDFYTAIAEVIRSYKTVLLFGPTSAKTELFHHLRKDHAFDSISIQLKESDQMTQAQQQSFVRHHFARH